MEANNNINPGSKWKDLDAKIQEGLKRTTAKLIAEEKKKNGYVVITDKDGIIRKIPASEL